MSFAKLQSEEVTSDSVKKKNNSAVTNQPTSITAVLEKDNVIDAEMRWCLKVVKSKFSQRSCNDMQSLFSVMFPDIEIARKMTLQKDKCKYVITWASTLLWTIIDTKCYSISISLFVIR